MAITRQDMDGTTLDPATRILIENGAKATDSRTLTAFGTWADGTTITVPGLAEKTLKVTAAGDIDIVGQTEVQAKATIAAFLSNAVGSLVDVAIAGSTMSLTAKAYGSSINGAAVSGTLLVVAGEMANGAGPEVSLVNAVGLGAVAAAYAAGFRPLELIAEWAPVVDSQLHDFSFTGAAWRSWELRLIDVGTDGQTEIVDLRIDGALATRSWQQIYAPNAVENHASPIVLLATDNRRSTVARLCKMGSGARDLSVRVAYLGGGELIVTGQGFEAPPIVSLGVSGSSADSFVGGVARVELWGERV